MKWEVKVTNVTTRLRRRTGPSTSYRIVDWKYPGDKGIVVDMKTVGGSTWYKWESSSTLWSCAKTANGKIYLEKVKDLEPAAPVTPPNKPKEPEETIDITKTTYVPENGSSKTLTDNLSYTAYNSSWYLPSRYTYKKTYAQSTIDPAFTYDEVSNLRIEKEISRIKYNMDISYANSDEVYNSGNAGYYSNLQKKLHNSFNRNKTAYPDKELSKTFAYVFFTRPDLYLTEPSSQAGKPTLSIQAQSDPKYIYMWRNNEWCIKSLTKNGNNYHKFLVLLSNEAKSFEVSDLALKTVEHGETYNGNKIIYGRTDHESNAAGEMSIRYTDTVNLDIFKMHLIWTDYINKVSRGVFSPKREYITSRILDYASSCYYFLCGPDGSTILYWQKLTGVFPVNTGENAFSWDSGTLLAKPEINIRYMYSMKTPMDIAHLEEFNSLTDAGKKSFKSIYSRENCQSGSTLTHAPYIWETKVNGKLVYRLMWLENK